MTSQAMESHDTRRQWHISFKECSGEGLNKYDKLTQCLVYQYLDCRTSEVSSNL